MDLRRQRLAKKEEKVSQGKSSEVKFRYETSDLLVFSHLRWNFVYQRPQHLMSRFAKYRRVFFFEEPVFEHLDEPELRMSRDGSGVKVVVPHLPFELSADSVEVCLVNAVDELLSAENIEDYTSWFYTPMALTFTRHLSPVVVVYDCMDELSLFKGAPPILVRNEAEMMAKADLVFTGGRSLYEAKRHLHDNVFSFPSGIDIEHFARARKKLEDPPDQREIRHPRLGYFGVIDERVDLDLLGRVARMRPNWSLVIIGPVAKIDRNELPQEENIYYLGQKDYRELPDYIAGWDVAIMPFARNEATRFISPTKTPEYLAAGRPVVSTSITDVVEPYGREKLVRIADTPQRFVLASEAAMREARDSAWQARVDRFLSKKTWDETWRRMALLEAEARRHHAVPRVSYAGWRESARPSV